MKQFGVYANSQISFEKNRNVSLQTFRQTRENKSRSLNKREILRPLRPLPSQVVRWALPWEGGRSPSPRKERGPLPPPASEADGRQARARPAEAREPAGCPVGQRCVRDTRTMLASPTLKTLVHETGLDKGLGLTGALRSCHSGMFPVSTVGGGGHFEILWIGRTGGSVDRETARRSLIVLPVGSRLPDTIRANFSPCLLHFRPSRCSRRRQEHRIGRKCSK